MITQCRFSNAVKFFEKGFIDRWNLKPYNNKYEDCLFFGIYNEQDVKAIKQHTGFKVIRDTNGNRLNYYKRFVGDKNLVVNAKIQYPNIYKHKNDLIINTTRIPLKDFSMFKPCKLGNKIYCYIGHDYQEELYGYSFAKEIQKEIDYEIMFTTNKYDMKYVHENYYKKCFINLNLTKYRNGGLTSATELAYMGRYTIGNTLVKETYIIPYPTKDRLIESIYEASRRINTTPSCLISKDAFIETDEWKYKDFWYEK